METKKGHLYNLLSVLMIALGPLLSKFGLLVISPGKAALINAGTVIIASYVYGIFVKKKVLFYFEKRMILLAVCNSLGIILLYISTDLLSPISIGFIGRFYTVFAVLLSVLLLKEKLTKNEVVFILLAIFGIFLFMEKGTDLHTDLLGYICGILYTFFFALSNVLIKKSLSKNKDSNSILFTNSSVSLVLILLFASFTGDLFKGDISLKGVGYIVISSLFAGFLGTILLYEALKRLRFAIANVTRAFSPLLLALISFPFFPIEITIQNTVGGIVLIGSILCLAVGDKKNEFTKSQKTRV